MNVNWEAVDLTDSNIVIDGITVDYTQAGPGQGAAHLIYIRRATRVIVQNCRLLGGGSSAAFLGCDDTLTAYNSIVGFSNCGPDHWDNPRNAKVIGNYIETTFSAQMVNFNPEPSSELGTGHIADGFVMTGNILVSSEATATPSQVEPLRIGNWIKNVSITNNVFKNCWLVARGDVRGITIANNTFSDFQGNTSAISCSARYSVNPSGVVISGNVVRDCLTESPNVSVIHAVSDSAIVTGNVILGTAYTVSSINVNPTTGLAYGNYVEKAPSAGRMQGGIRLLNGIANFYGWSDTDGNSPIMAVMDTNAWGFWATDGSGGLRNVFQMTMASATSSMACNVPFRSAGLFYQSNAVNLEATGSSSSGALLLAANVNQVATVAAGTGVRLPNQSFYGGDFTVINDGANTLKVYPTTGGNIDALAANIPYDLPAGSVGVWTYTHGTTWRTKSVTP
jgi:hypothetical protein